MKKNVLLIVIVFSCLSLTAQKEETKEYAKMKTELNERIFGTADPFFKTTAIPEKYKNESIVVLAQKYSLESDSKFKFRIGLFASSGVQYSFFDIFRRKLLINDKSALEEYSQFSFTKLQAKERGVLGKERNYTFINIRVIKPDGSVKDINIDESSVVLKDDKKAAQSKIAIPDLNVGDIIDYYVANYYQESEASFRDNSTRPLLYVLGDDYPVLNYVISIQFDSRIAAEYQCINGAPDFRVGPDEDGKGNVLNMAVKDVPKIKGLIWSSTTRQLPIIRINYRLGNITKLNGTTIKQGRIERASKVSVIDVEETMASYLNARFVYDLNQTKSYKSFRSDVKDAWKDYISKNPKADNPDSIAMFVFRYINWSTYFESFTTNTNYNTAFYSIGLADQLQMISMFCSVLQAEFKTEVDFIVVSGRESYTRDNIFTVRDFSLLVRVNEPKPKFFSFADNFDFGNMVPYDLQGEKAKLFPISMRSMFGVKALGVDAKAGSMITLPSSEYKQNYKKEIVTITPDAGDMQLLGISRKVNVTGQLKKDEQAAIVIYEEVASPSAMSIGREGNLIALNSGRKKSEKIDEGDLQSLLTKARDKHKEDFENEIERSFSAKPKELKKYKMLNPGISAESPFEYEQSFTMEGWVKKAGNNYIIDIGKVITSQIAIDKDQRERTKDIYMPFPRGFAYQVEFIIPQGYTVDGLDKLNGTIDNETGAFKSTAVLEGNKLILKVEKYYTKYFYSSDKWPMLLAFLDKAMDYNQQKLLLKKI